MLKAAPKTIIITTFPTKNYPNLSGGGQMINSNSFKRCLSSISSIRSSTSPPLSSSSPCPSSVEDDYDFDSQPARKRERLNHLTQDEKMYRRKMKNRVAAQIARDRKKSQTSDLAQRVQLLENENDNLKHQNNDLASLSARLSAENSRLKSHLINTHSKLRSVVSQPLKNELVVESDGEFPAFTTLPFDGVIIKKSDDVIMKKADDVIIEKADEARAANVAAVAIESAASINDLQQQGQATEVTRRPSDISNKSRWQKPVAALAWQILLAIYTALATTVSDKSSIGCGDFLRANCAAGQVDRVLKEMETAIGRLPVNKTLLLNKLEDLLASRKVTRMKVDPVTLRCAS